MLLKHALCLGIGLSAALGHAMPVCAQSLFDAPRYYWTGVTGASYVEYSSLRAADIDQDGSLDLAMSHWLDSTLSILFNDGAGELNPVSPMASGRGVVDLCLGDFNGDEYPDIATCQGFVDSVWIFINHGDSTFSAPIKSGAPFAPYALACVDFDQDLDMDLAIAGGSSVTVMINDGNALFTSPVPVVGVMGSLGGEVHIADFNGDLRLDLAVGSGNFAGPLGGRLSIIFNYGSIDLKPMVDYQVGNNPLGIESADIDNDGDLDIGVACFSFPGVISILVNDGSGAFATSVHYIDSSDAYGGTDLSRGDFNEDGFVDFVVTPGNGFDVYWLENEGTHSFSYPVPYSMSPFPYAGDQIVSGDLDRDGHVDFAATMWEEDSVAVFFNRTPDRGDVNNDGNLSTSDIIYLVDYLFRKGTAPWPSESVGDCNCSGQVSVSDVVYLINYVFRAGARPGCP